MASSGEIISEDGWRGTRNTLKLKNHIQRLHLKKGRNNAVVVDRKELAQKLSRPLKDFLSVNPLYEDNPTILIGGRPKKLADALEV
jgi:hypothetical protein